MARFCTNCGSQINEGQQVCLNCGHMVEREAESLKKEVSSSNVENCALAGMILGLVSIIAWFIPLFGYPVTICAIVFSNKGMKASNPTKAKAGLILGIVFLIITVINSALGVIMNLGSI